MEAQMPNKQFKLCYVDLPWAYFTTQDLKDQWGDDWDDSPYEDNAGLPYDPRYFHYADERGSIKSPEDWNEDGTPKWEIKKIALYGEVYAPCDLGSGSGSHQSVKSINAGAVAWLAINKYGDDPVYIQAGTSLEDVIRICQEKGIEVFEKKE
jgi:hypothetical protein